MRRSWQDPITRSWSVGCGFESRTYRLRWKAQPVFDELAVAVSLKQVVWSHQPAP